MDNIVIIPTDKGGKCVNMDRDNYLKKVEEKLNDKNVYETVKNPLTKIKKSISEFTERLFTHNKIT